MQASYVLVKEYRSAASGVWSWFFFVGIWNYLAVWLYVGFPTSSAAVIASVVALIIAEILVIIVSVNTVWSWISHRIKGWRALLSLVDVWAALQMGNSGIFMVAWILDSSVTKTGQINILSGTTEPFGVYTILVANAMALFSTAGPLSTLPVSVLVTLWASLVTSAGRWFFVFAFAPAIQRVLEQIVFGRSGDRPFGPGDNPARERLVAGSKNLQRRNRKRTAVFDAMQGTRVYVQTGENQWMAKR